VILILNHLHTDDFDFDFESFMYKVILILIWNHFTSDFTHHWLYQSVSHGTTNRPWEGRGQGHVTKLRILHPMKYRRNG